jgi:hypothetical protein
MEPIKYHFGDKTYIQKPLVLGQMRQLSTVLQGFKLSGNLSVADIVDFLGAELPKALAVVLTEEGKSPKNKDLTAMAEELEYSISLDDAVKVAEDFFACNQVTSLSEKITKMFGGMMSLESLEETGSNTSVSMPQEEILQSGTGSSGTAARTN